MIYGQPITLGGKKAEGEISITANGVYDVAEYATANVNVPPDAPVLLWTNASPSSRMSNGTAVDIAGAGYQGFIVEARYSTTGGGYGYSLLFKSTSRQIISAVNTDSAPSVDCGSWRYINSVTDSKITFGISYNGGSSGFDTSATIPTRIWGVKFTL